MKYEHFITNNSEDSLSTTINNFLPICDKLYFLVGYFYFSGFQKIYKNITETQELKILVGLDAESRLIKSYTPIKNEEIEKWDDEKRKSSFYETLVKTIGETSYYDNRESKEAFELFYKKIKNGTLEIRQTSKPCHAKMYILEHSKQTQAGGSLLGTCIIGSSNLSANGLENNFEINVQNTNNHMFEEGRKIFINLWKESTELVNKDNINDFEERFVKKVWFNKTCSPFVLYIRVLIEYFGDARVHNGLILPSHIDSDYANLQYQIDAIAKGIRSLEEHNGVIIADVVGLGKSIIATTIAANMHLPVLLIVPPHLIPQWREYSLSLREKGEVISRGKLEDAIKIAQQWKNERRKYLVIIDEGHIFKNDETSNYDDVETICKGEKTIILTATPFNNHIEDIFNLVNLFQTPEFSTVKTVNNLAEAERELNGKYKKTYNTLKDCRNILKKLESNQKLNQKDNQTLKKVDEDTIPSSNIEELKLWLRRKITEKQEEIKDIAKKVSYIINEVVVRRNRKDLTAIPKYSSDLKKQNIRFPEVNDPKDCTYDLENISEKYVNTLNKIYKKGEDAPFKAARYKITSYVKDNPEIKKALEKYIGIKSDNENNADFLRRLLVRRFESSIASFQKTLENILNAYRNILQIYNNTGRAVISKKLDLTTILNWEPEELLEAEHELQIFQLSDISESDTLSVSKLSKAEENKYAEKGIYFIHKDYIRDSFKEEMNSDIAILEEIQKDWKSFSPENDPKLNGLIKAIKKQLEEDKNRKIIVFSEFADTIEYLAKNFHETEIIKPIFYTSKESYTKRKEIRIQFDASCKETNENDNRNLLFTTDALSEGVNLNKAGTIFNYDIPYNPTRVIQRVGRINRVNRKMFDNLYIYNYFPSSFGEGETNVRNISDIKMRMINWIFGEDTKYLTEKDELRKSLDSINIEEIANWDTKYQIELENIKKDFPVEYEEAKNLPSKIHIARQQKDKDHKGALVFSKKGDVAIFSFCDTDTKEVKNLTYEEAINLFRADKEDDNRELSANFFDCYEKIKEKMREYSSALHNDNTTKQAMKALSQIETKIRQSNYTNSQNKDYLSKLRQLVQEHAFSSNKAKLKQIGKAGERVQNNDNLDDIFAELQKKIPNYYLEELMEQYNKEKSEVKDIVLSEEFIGDDIKGELL